MRPKTFWIAAVPVLVGSSLSLCLTGKFNFWIFLITLLGAVSIQAMSNMVNDHAYNERKAENGTRVGLPRATTEGWISMSAGKKMIRLSLVLCCIFGVLLVILGGLPIASIAVLSVLCGYCYMGGPKPIAYMPIGEFLVFLFYGIFAVCGTYWLQNHSINLLILLPAMSLGLFGAAVLFVNNYRDVEHDISVGRRTLVAVCGRKFSQILYAFMIFLPFVFVGWMVPFHQNYWPFLFVLIALPRASMLPQYLKKATPQDTTKIMLQTIKLEFTFGFLLTLSGLAITFLNQPLYKIFADSFVSPF